MNNTIEVLEVLQGKVGVKDWEALKDAIATLKALESAEGLPEKMEETEMPKHQYSTSEDMQDWAMENSYIRGFNEYHGKAIPILAKQILKNEEAQSITAHEIEGTTEYKCEHKANNSIGGDCVWCALSVAETGLDKQRAKVKELEAKIKEIENGTR